MEVNFDDESASGGAYDDFDDYSGTYSDDYSGTYSDDIIDVDNLKENNNKVIIEIHQKLDSHKIKLQSADLDSFSELNSEYRNFYNEMKEIKIDSDTNLIDVPVIKMDIEQIEKTIKNKQLLRTSQNKNMEKTKLKSSLTNFKWKFNFKTT